VLFKEIVIIANEADENFMRSAVDEVKFRDIAF